MAPQGNGVRREHARTRSTHQHREYDPDWSLSKYRDYIRRLQPKADHALQARVYRFHPAGLIERHAGRYAFYAAVYDPVHDAHVLGKPAAGRFEPGGNADLLIDRALREQPSLAIKAISAR